MLKFAHQLQNHQQKKEKFIKVIPFINILSRLITEWQLSAQHGLRKCKCLHLLSEERGVGLQVAGRTRGTVEEGLQC